MCTYFSLECGPSSRKLKFIRTDSGGSINGFPTTCAMNTSSCSWCKSTSPDSQHGKLVWALFSGHTAGGRYVWLRMSWSNSVSPCKLKKWSEHTQIKQHKSKEDKQHGKATNTHETQKLRREDLFTHDFLNQLQTNLKMKSVYSSLCEHCVSDFTSLQMN